MPVDWEARRRHVVSSPEVEGVDALRGGLGASEVAVERRLGGGVVSATHLVVATYDGGATRRLVLKRFPPENGYDEQARLEWERLSFAARCDVPLPEPVALDVSGEWFGVPALVMTALDGEVVLHPDDPESWIVSLARALAAVHAAPLDGDVPGELLTPHLLERWQPWWDEEDDRRRAVERTVGALRGEARALPRVLCHGDFHPGNVLFGGGVLSGVVDWSSARIAPRETDVAGCRADLAVHPGGDAPDAFLRAYEAAAGRQLDGIASWDVLWGDHAMRFGPTWVDSFAEAGVTLTADEIVVRAAGFVDAALQRPASRRRT